MFRIGRMRLLASSRGREGAMRGPSGAACAALAAMVMLAGCQKQAPAQAAAPPAAAADANAAAAKAFLDGLYAHYKSSENNNFQMFDANEAEVFDADTIALLKANEKALKGELGDIDGDWLCDCQDFVSLKSQVTVASASATAAKAHADFTDVGMPGEGARHADFDLVRTPAGWRVHDITSPGQPSLRHVLNAEIARLKGAGKQAGSPDEAP